MTSAFWEAVRGLRRTAWGRHPRRICAWLDSWAVALAWKQAFPNDRSWAFAWIPKRCGSPLSPRQWPARSGRPVFEQIAQPFEDTGEASISDENVFLYEAPKPWGSASPSSSGGQHSSDW
jgi:hypothetical protein